MSDNLQIQLASYPEGHPRAEHFVMVQAAIPDVTEGQVLCETLYLSLDPYMRSQIADRHISASVSPGEVMNGECVSRVIHSESKLFQQGDIVRCFAGWQKYSLHSAEALQPVAKTIDPPSYALSVLGMTGLTAYAGLIWQAKPQRGDTVVIPAAVGGVGSVAGQLAKIYGCTVIGIAGTQEKCRYATTELGYDACINRNSEDVAEQLDDYCPDGIDIFFDLVGGDILHIASQRLAVGARIILCGLMSEYNKTTRTPGPAPGLWIKSRAIVYGLVVYDFEPRRAEFVEACLPYIKDGRLKMPEDISQGLERAPEAFCRLMAGETLGKTVVKVNV